MPEVAEQLIPKDYEIGRRRPTPGNGFIEALYQDNVDVIRGGVKRITEDGLVSEDGTQHKPRYPTIGRGGRSLSEEWKEASSTYLLMSVPHFPNYLIFNGPFGVYGHGSILPVMERLGRHFMQIIEKMSDEWNTAFEPTEEAVADFAEHRRSFLPRTTWSGTCNSWFKQGSVKGEVMMWPGSRIHFFDIMATPRWEDYHLTRACRNRFFYFGNGFAERECDGHDLSWYLGLLDGEDKQPQYKDADIAELLDMCKRHRERCDGRQTSKRTRRTDIRRLEPFLAVPSHIETPERSERLDHLPSEDATASCVSAYFVNFHPHFPVLHRPTFSVASTPKALAYIVIAIGNLYRRHTDPAVDIDDAHQQSDKLWEASAASLQGMAISYPGRWTDNWIIQASLLSVIYGAFAAERFPKSRQLLVNLVSDIREAELLRQQMPLGDRDDSLWDTVDMMCWATKISLCVPGDFLICGIVDTDITAAFATAAHLSLGNQVLGRRSRIMVQMPRAFGDEGFLLIMEELMNAMNSLWSSNEHRAMTEAPWVSVVGFKILLDLYPALRLATTDIERRVALEASVARSFNPASARS
ncbi:Fc.00g074390.m01.CDS01 [Cosmosporella sp. VM-42]